MEPEKRPAIGQNRAEVEIEGVEREVEVLQGAESTANRELIEVFGDGGRSDRNEAVATGSGEEFIEQIDQMRRGEIDPPNDMVFIVGGESGASLTHRVDLDHHRIIHDELAGSTGARHRVSR